MVKFNIHVTSEPEETQHHIATPISPIVGCACMHILRLIILGRNTLLAVACLYSGLSIHHDTIGTWPVFCMGQASLWSWDNTHRTTDQVARWLAEDSNLAAGCHSHLGPTARQPIVCDVCVCVRARVRVCVRVCVRACVHVCTRECV